MTEGPYADWEAKYAAGVVAPWDIGRPQPAFARLADEGRLSGRVLDAGCGSGENALLAASRGADVTGIDIAPAAIARARAKASGRGLAARFEVADALCLGHLGLTADTVLDSGVFHIFDDGDRARYVAGLAAVLRPGGACYLLCYSDRAPARPPGTRGPRRIRADELLAAFSDGWTAESITASIFVINKVNGMAGGHAWLATLRRVGPGTGGFAVPRR
jgi:SAM-dependent methyltransferase